MTIFIFILGQTSRFYFCQQLFFHAFFVFLKDSFLNLLFDDFKAYQQILILDHSIKCLLKLIQNAMTSNIVNVSVYICIILAIKCSTNY